MHFGDRSGGKQETRIREYKKNYLNKKDSPAFSVVIYYDCLAIFSKSFSQQYFVAVSQTHATEPVKYPWIACDTQLFAQQCETKNECFFLSFSFLQIFLMRCIYCTYIYTKLLP